MITLSSQTQRRYKIIQTSRNRLGLFMCNMKKIYSIAAVLGVLTLVSVEASKITDDYFDTVLSVHLPENLMRYGLDRLQLPDFSHHFQNRTADGGITNGHVTYSKGNLTGLGLVVRNATCGDQKWMYGNITANCTMVLPLVQATYTARIKYEHTTYELPLKVVTNITMTYADVMISSSPYTNVPVLKALKLTEMGSVSVRFFGISQLHYHTLEYHFRDKFLSVFYDVFYGTFKDALASSVQSVSLPPTFK